MSTTNGGAKPLNNPDDYRVVHVPDSLVPWHVQKRWRLFGLSFWSTVSKSLSATGADREREEIIAFDERGSRP